MATRSINKEKTELLINVEVDPQEWKELQNKAFLALAAKQKIKGFRAGNIKNEAFLKQARFLISNSTIWNRAIDNKLLSKYQIKAAQLLTPEDLIVDSPTYQVNKYSLEELEITFIFPLLPTIDSLDYKNLDLKLKPFKASSKEIKAEIKKFASSHGSWKESDEAIEENDEVTFDFEGRIDGELFDGGSFEKHTLRIGSQTFIPGFEEQMLGMKKNDEGEIKVTFPDDYYISTYAQKEAIFKIKIHSVKKAEAFLLSEANLAKIALPGVKTEKDLVPYFEKTLTEQNLERNSEVLQNKAFSKIIKNSKINFPRALLLKEMSKIRKNFLETLEQQGISLNEYKKLTKYDDAKLGEEIHHEAEKALAKTFLMVEIMRRENISVQERNYEEYYFMMSQKVKMSIEALKKSLPKENLRPIISQKILLEIFLKYNDPKSYQELIDWKTKSLQGFTFKEETLENKDANETKDLKSNQKKLSTKKSAPQKNVITKKSKKNLELKETSK